MSPHQDRSGVELWWLPLGGGDTTGCVRVNGHIFEALVAARGRRPRRDLYHSALVVHLDGVRSVIEMTPVWGNPPVDRGVVGEGPVGLPWLGRSRFFRYEVRCWPGGVIPDEAEAVQSPHVLSRDPRRSRRVLDLVPECPRVTWGRDELGAGEMWNSNSLVSWVLERSGHDLAGALLPPGGRAPGWDAGRAVARRSATAASTSTDPVSHPPVLNGPGSHSARTTPDPTSTAASTA